MGFKDISLKLKEKNRTLWEFISYALFGCLTSVIDLGCFLLCNNLIFASLRSTAFSWWLINYTPENGGLGAFWSFAISFAASQIFNFFIQRKKTFSSNNNAAVSGLLYAAMVILTYFFQLWLPSVIGEAVTRVVGENWASVALKCINMTTAFLIQFPINKWVIMRRKPTDKEIRQ